MGVNEEEDVLIVADVAAWRAWLDEHEDASDGVWLVVAKKGTVTPTSLNHAQALDEALCSGWIDGRRRGRDETTFRQHFTPRRRRSLWSARNVEYVARLEAEGRMRPRGRREIDRAKEDGRWDRAYQGSAAATVPDDLDAALREHPGARERFDALNAQERYSILHGLMTAASDATRARRLDRAVAALAAEPAP